MRIGYIRVSTVGQNTARQEEQLRDLDKVFIEKQSGKDVKNRPALQSLLAYVREGDTVVVESISRFARNTRDLLNLIEELRQKDVRFVSLKENIDTTTPQGQFMLTIFASMAQLERAYILQNQREGIELAKAQGKYKGRKPIAVDADSLRRECARWRAGEITAREAMRRLGLKPNTFYRRVREVEGEAK